MGVVAQVSRDLILDAFVQASELWEFRRSVAQSWVHDLVDLVSIDDRLRALVDCLVAAEGDGWALIEDLLSRHMTAGSAFVATVVGGLSGERERLEWSVAHHVRREQFSVPLRAALGWLPFHRLADALEHWGQYQNLRWRALAIAGYCAHRYAPPEAWVRNAIEGPCEAWQREGLLAAGLFGLGPMESLADAHARAQSFDIRFEAARAWLRRRGGLASRVMWRHALGGGDHAEVAAELALRHIPPGIAARWVREADCDSHLTVAVLRGMASTGSPRFVPLLLDALDNAELAPIAGYCLYTMTGLNLDAEPGFAVEPPVHVWTDLPFPDAALVRQWWTRQRRRFGRGGRWLLGQPRDVDGCRHALSSGSQHVRWLVADDLRRRCGSQTLPMDVAAPAWRQRRWLAAARVDATPSKRGWW